MIGAGGVDYDAFLSEIAKLPEETPVIIEHRDSLEEDLEEVAFVRERAGKLGIRIL